MLKKDQIKKVLVVFGPQGSGKSTQVDLLSSKYQLTVFEAGDQLRRQALVDEELHQIIKAGRLVDNSKMMKLADHFITTHTSANGYIFDGYPRNVKQSIGFMKLAKQNKWKVFVIYIHISDGTAKERLSNRYEIINGEKFIREDDQPEIAERRLNIFKQTTLPIKDFLADHFTLIEIDGEPEETTVWADLQTKLDKIIHD